MPSRGRRVHDSRRNGPPRLPLRVAPAPLAVCRFAPGDAVPEWAIGGEFVTISRTPDELSITCEQARVPWSVAAERDYRAIKVIGPLPMDLVGIFASIAGPLAAADVPIFAISTFETDYVLVKQDHLEAALCTLRDAGHTVSIS